MIIVGEEKEEGTTMNRDDDCGRGKGRRNYNEQR